ncbi:serine/threonine kinase [Geitlerinema sp. FC II]|uniref:serine/threonine protein kinase n=1 Tax=Baaleninema simplex TaxID=2862350 RepID=UPI000349C5ED|nr:serine/threonine-protein kinase [Baaleninema simplex]PPT10459.1 serine/threonine kinase [Geitlerinema sp. FC II]
MKVRAGTLLQGGKYAIEDTLGQGYFGTTYRATHARLWQPVVIKTLSDTLLSHPDSQEFVRRFVEQSRLLARCHHPNLPRVLDLFEENGQPFAVMDYIPGATLAQLVRDGKPMAVDRAVDYVRQLAEAVEALHENGLLHRDVKPEHAIRTIGSDRVVLVEIGLTRDLDPEVERTHSNLLSPGYAAPEQYDCHRPRTPATDVYALAATLYTLLSGQPPTIAALRDRVPLNELRPDRTALDPDLDRAIAKGLELDPQRRPTRVNEWLALLPPSRRDRPVVGVSANPSTGKPQKTAKPSKPPKPIFARPWVPALFFSTSIVAAIGGAGIVVALKSGLADRPDAPPSQLLRSTPPPLPQDFPNPDTEVFEEPFQKPGDWTYTPPVETETEYSRNDWPAANSPNSTVEPTPSWAEPTSAPYHDDSGFVPVQTEAPTAKSESEPVLSEEPFTATDPEAPTVWSDASPEPVEATPSGEPPIWEDLKNTPVEPEPVPELSPEKENLEPFKEVPSSSTS